MLFRSCVSFSFFYTSHINQYIYLERRMHIMKKLKVCDGKQPIFLPVHWGKKVLQKKAWATSAVHKFDGFASGACETISPHQIVCAPSPPVGAHYSCTALAVLPILVSLSAVWNVRRTLCSPPPPPFEGPACHQQCLKSFIETIPPSLLYRLVFHRLLLNR